ncbi:MAG: ZIP family metal transporter [Ignavibacteriales bacterium]
MNREVLLAFFITTLAGLSTIIGTILIFIKKESNIIVPASLSLAAGVMICTSITDLIPNSIELLQYNFYIIPSILICLIFISLGVFISLLIDLLLPNSENKDKKLYRVGIISMLAIILHNIPEGIATFMASNTNIKLGISLAIAIALHNIPEGISISIPIFHSTKSKSKAFLYTFISGTSELLGAILTYLFLSNYMNNIVMGIIFSIIAGIMIHISIYELLPTSLNYKKYKITFIYFLIGIFIMIINHFVFLE